MKRIKSFFTIVVSVVLLLNGCATVNSLDKTRAEFPKRVKAAVFSGSYNEVFAAVKAACRDLKLTIYSEDEPEGRIYARSSLRWLIILISWASLGFGEKVGIYLTRVDVNSTRVEIGVQKAFIFDIGYADWRQRILTSIVANLK